MADSPLPLRLKLPYATEEEFLAKVGPGLARGTIFLGTRTPVFEGSQVAFRFVLADGRQVLAGTGRVASLSRDPARPGMTLAIQELDAASQVLVARLAPAPPSPSATAAAARPRPTPPPNPTPNPALDEKRRRRQAILDGPAPAPPPTAEEPVLGIDLGTTNCRVAVWIGGEVKLLPLEGRATNLPSVVAFDDKGRLLVGTRAKAHLLIDPKSAIFGAKRLIGRRARSRKVREMVPHFPYEICADAQGDAAVKVQGNVLSIPHVTSHLLAEIRNRASETLGRPLKRAVIGVPAYFNDRQRHAVRFAGQLGGLDVVRVVSEPTAVAVAFGHGKGLARKRLLVYDLGGGTFDASLLEAVGDDFEVVAAGGDNFLGGLDFDARIADWLAERFAGQHGFALPEDPLTRQRVRDAGEMAKIQLSERHEARVHVPFVATRDGAPVDLDVPLDRPRFEALTGSLVERSLEVVKTVFAAAQIPTGAVDEVLLVGGQSQSPSVRSSLERLLGRGARGDLDPHASVAIGAALVGRAIQQGESPSVRLSISEVLSLGIGVVARGTPFSRVLERGTRLPCEKSASFAADAQGQLVLTVYQGDGASPSENEFLGRLVVPAAAGAPVEVAFALSADGALSLSARGADGARHALTLATADLAAEEDEPPPAEPPLAGTAEEKKGLFSRLFNRK